MARRPGPAPKPGRERRNEDSLLGGSGEWREAPNAPLNGAVPSVPEWVTASLKNPDATLAAYEVLAKLPQAALWTGGDWFSVWLTLPLLDRYLARPGSEGFKAILSGLGAGPGLTEADLLKLRRRLVEPATEAAEDEQTAPPPPRRLRAVDPPAADTA